MSRVALALLASLMTCGTALAASLPDRTGLTYDENVIVNTACFKARAKGDSAFNDCVQKQIVALKAHPSPDRTGLSAAQNRAVEDKCEFYRRVDIAEYNDCLTAAIAASPASTQTDKAAGIAPNYLEVFTHGSAEPEKGQPAATKVAAVALPLPATMLPKRPDHLSKQAMTPAELFKTLGRSVFVVMATSSLADARARNISQGSAVAVSEHLLLTNCHVVHGRELIKIIQDSRVANAKLVAEDTRADRCVLQADGVTLVPVSGIRAFEDLAVGEIVFAIGAPSGLERTLSEGLLSGLRHQPGRSLIQTSAAISPGSSGGGLFDEHGNLIGITTMHIVGAQNLNLAVSAGDYWN
jgi:S1-C subfamily serine protease